jgi:hypothetical protein
MKELLKNNSNEMNTIVETYVIEETAELIYDNEKLEQWNSLVDELGLDGQTQIVKPEKSPIPFMHIKDSMKNVFETLCPRKVDVKEYNVTPIPVEILSLVSLSINEKYFSKVEIWYDEKSPDPLCIGILDHFIIHKKGTYTEISDKIFTTKKDANDFIKNSGLENAEPWHYSSRDNYYLLGKWADVKHSFEELKEMAIKRYMSEKENELKETIKNAERGLIDLETEAFKNFN